MPEKPTFTRTRVRLHQKGSVGDVTKNLFPVANKTPASSLRKKSTANKPGLKINTPCPMPHAHIPIFE
jgi:hypothetical protein